MTLTAALGQRPSSNASALPGFAPSAPSARGILPATKMPTRSFEVAALRADGSLYIGQDKAPAIPLFESAFSAFARGTLIATVHGDVAVEDLQPGDMINTSTGEPAKLIWVGSSSFVPADAGRRMPLIRIMADTFGQGRPSSFLTVGPAARILHTPHHLRAEAGEKRMLTPVREFLDGVNVIEVVPPTPVRLFHICLDRHAAIRAGGVEMETFHPGAKATHSVSHSLRDRFLGMFPQISHITDFGPLAHPRAPEIQATADTM
ncbi:Hint domain-containing protein [Sulfitobacter sp. F26204]|uniref:Hint domain-containing protein n=1 Tax=Sulfitobacter sp. F26204 TaxID=2996014 RepID=UPI00225E26B0|nr:Hint domain-containing protein [Sulfitobacter sp. F26204]MCX7558873.1 Hint domain-containing protein [Sulfitobacter sp. F26204]